MSVFLYALIKHDFKDFDNHEKCLAFLEETSKAIDSHYKQKGIDPEIELHCENWDEHVHNHMYVIVSIEVTLALHKDYWEVYQCYNYQDLAKMPEGKWSVRDSTEEVASILGKTEAWYCDEFRFDNGLKGFDPCVNNTFSDWIKALRNNQISIKSFNGNNVNRTGKPFPRLNPVYHDDFALRRKDIERGKKILRVYEDIHSQNLAGKKYDLRDHELMSYIASIVSMVHPCYQVPVDEDVLSEAIAVAERKKCLIGFVVDEHSKNNLDGWEYYVKYYFPRNVADKDLLQRVIDLNNSII